MTEEYENEESRQITDFLNRARKKLIEDGLPEECLPYEAKVVFIRKKQPQPVCHNPHELAYRGCTEVCKHFKDCEVRKLDGVS